MFTVVVILVLCVGLAGCGDSTETQGVGQAEAAPILDYRSMLDTELNMLFPLGISRSEVEEVLGQPVTIDDEWGTFEYQNGMVFIYEGDVAILIEGENGLESGRFEILGFRVGMTRGQIASNFELDEDMSELLTSATLNWVTYVYRQEQDNVFRDVRWQERPERDSIILVIEKG